MRYERHFEKLRLSYRLCQRRNCPKFEPMNLLIHLLALIEAIVADRTRIAVENVLLRQ
jgi:hypothetical protein